MAELCWTNCFFGSTTKCILLGCFADNFLLRNLSPSKNPPETRWFLVIWPLTGVNLVPPSTSIYDTLLGQVKFSIWKLAIPITHVLITYAETTFFCVHTTKPAKILSLVFRFFGRPKRCQKMPFAPNRHVGTSIIYILTANKLFHRIEGSRDQVRPG